MPDVLKVTVRNGVLIPDRPPGANREGRQYKVYLMEEEPSEASMERFFRFVTAHSFVLPEGYRFDREELHER